MPTSQSSFTFQPAAVLPPFSQIRQARQLPFSSLRIRSPPLLLLSHLRSENRSLPAFLMLASLVHLVFQPHFPLPPFSAFKSGRSPTFPSLATTARKGQFFRGVFACFSGIFLCTQSRALAFASVAPSPPPFFFPKNGISVGPHSNWAATSPPSPPPAFVRHLGPQAYRASSFFARDGLEECSLPPLPSSICSYIPRRGSGSEKVPLAAVPKRYLFLLPDGTRSLSTSLRIFLTFISLLLSLVGDLWSFRWIFHSI